MRAPGREGPLFLLDTMSLAFRAFFALPEALAMESGVVTNALHGFVSMLVNVVRDHHPGALGAAFDLPGETFRDALVADYKGGRAPTPEILLAQFEMIRAFLSTLGVPLLEAPGYEADDVLATLATQARDRECDVVVVTGDRDCFQLVEDPHVRVLYTRRGVSEYSLYDEAGILERTGAPAPLYPLLAALRGDNSDNLPGVPGVGDKTAAKLAVRFGDLDSLYAHLDELSPKLAESLAAHESQVRANALAIPLVRDVPLEVAVEDLSLGGWDHAAVRGVFERYELRTLWQRMTPLLADGTFGDPAPGSGSDEQGVAPEGKEPEPLDLLVARDGPAAVRSLQELRAPVAVAGRWEGVPGRGPLRGICMVSDAKGVWIGRPLLDERETADAVREVLRGPVVGHGVKELLRSLLPLGIDCTGLEMDVEVASYLLDPSTGDYALQSLWTDEEGLEEVDARHAARDAQGAGSAAPLLRRRIDEGGLGALHDDVERPLVRVLARMEVAGIRVNVEELRRLTAELAVATAQLLEEVQALAGHEFNVNSTPQLRTVLYTELKLVPGRKTKTGYSTDAATLEGLREAHPIVDRMLRYRELEKLRSTYGEALLSEVAPDGRIHASFRQTVARTGRLSSERPNLHNIPKRRDSGSQFRRAFVPAHGCRLLVADYDQVELRVIAHLSGDPGLVSAFAAGEDIHRAVAAGVYGVAPSEVTSAQRDRAKMVSYGLMYGMEAYGLARRLSTSVEDATEIMQRYFAAFPRVRAYMLTTVDEARARGYTRTEMGRRRPLPELAERNFARRAAAERQAMNAGIQGLAADLFKLALVKLDGALERGGMASRIVLQVHDEVLVEAVPEEESEVEALTKEALGHAVTLSVPLEVTMAWGSSWAVKGG